MEFLLNVSTLEPCLMTKSCPVQYNHFMVDKKFTMFGFIFAFSQFRSLMHRYPN